MGRGMPNEQVRLIRQRPALAPVPVPVQRPRIRYFERMRRQNMYRRPVNRLDIDHPEVEIEVPEWIADAEEILEAQEKA